MLEAVDESFDESIGWPETKDDEGDLTDDSAGECEYGERFHFGAETKMGGDV